MVWDLGKQIKQIKRETWSEVGLVGGITGTESEIQTDSSPAPCNT